MELIILLLSIVLLTRNRKDELVRAINSCLENKINAMEIVVIDNGSTDGTTEAVNRLAEEQPIPIRYVYNQTNTGVAQGRNQGFALAQGEFVFLLDDDAWIQSPNALPTLVQAMQSDSNIGAISTAVYDVSSKQYQKCTSIAKSNRADGMKEILYYTGGASIIRKNLFNDKLYPDTLFYGSEEIYASLHMHSLAMDILYDEDIVLIHEPSSQSRLSEEEMMFNNIFNLFLVKYLRYPLIARWLLLIGLLLRINKFSHKKIHSIRKSFSLFKQRFRKEDVGKINVTCLLKIVAKFGVKAIL